MKALADDVLSRTPRSEGALDRLLEHSRSKDYWDHYYAITFLGQVATGSSGTQRDRIIPVLVTALTDEDQAIRRSAVIAIRDIGANAVDTAIPQLIRIVKSGDEIDVSWFAAEALGKTADRRVRENVVRALFEALDRKPASNIPPDAPQIRYYALSAIEELGRSNPSGILSELEKRSATQDVALRKKLAEAIARLKLVP